LKYIKSYPKNDLLTHFLVQKYHNILQHNGMLGVGKPGDLPLSPKSFNLSREDNKKTRR
jgi:hypothetical protein